MNKSSCLKDFTCCFFNLTIKGDELIVIEDTINDLINVLDQKYVQ